MVNDRRRQRFPPILADEAADRARAADQQAIPVIGYVAPAPGRDPLPPLVDAGAICRTDSRPPGVPRTPIERDLVGDVTRALAALLGAGATGLYVRLSRNEPGGVVVRLPPNAVDALVAAASTTNR
jgi:hypothetical protein